MKSLIVVFGVGALGGAWLAFAPCSPFSVFRGSCCSSDTDPAEYMAVQGRYLELRDSSIERDANDAGGPGDVWRAPGRSALAGWQILAGAFDGQDLAGIDVVAAIESEGNLADGGDRRSIVYLPADCEGARSDAALAWLRAAHGSQLGEIVAVHSAPVHLSFDGDAFELAVADVARASGSIESETRSCSIPSDAVCRPLASLQDQALGAASEASFAGESGLSAWSRPGASDAFEGSFRWVQPDEKTSCCPTQSSRCTTTEPGMPSE